MGLFVLAHKSQMPFFPSDVKWTEQTLLIKRTFIEAATDDVFQKWGSSLQEREAMMDSNHVFARLLQQWSLVTPQSMGQQSAQLNADTQPLVPAQS